MSNPNLENDEVLETQTNGLTSQDLADLKALNELARKTIQTKTYYFDYCGAEYSMEVAQKLLTSDLIERTTEKIQNVYNLRDKDPEDMTGEEVRLLGQMTEIIGETLEAMVISWTLPVRPKAAVIKHLAAEDVIEMWASISETNKSPKARGGRKVAQDRLPKQKKANS